MPRRPRDKITGNSAQLTQIARHTQSKQCKARYFFGADWPIDCSLSLCGLRQTVNRPIVSSRQRSHPDGGKMPRSRDNAAKSLPPTALSAAEIAAFQAVDLAEQKQSIGQSIGLAQLTAILPRWCPRWCPGCLPRLTIVTIAGLLLAGFAAWQ